MKPIVPSTRGLLRVALQRTGAQQITGPPAQVRFRSIRGIVNSMLKDWDTKDNPVKCVSITFHTEGDRSRNGQT